MKNIFRKLEAKRVGYDLFAKLTRIVVTLDFSPSLFRCKRGILPLSTKLIF